MINFTSSMRRSRSRPGMDRYVNWRRKRGFRKPKSEAREPKEVQSGENPKSGNSSFHGAGGGPAEFEGRVERPDILGAAECPIAKRDRGNPELILDNLRVGGDRAKTSATHRLEEGALCGDAVER